MVFVEERFQNSKLLKFFTPYLNSLRRNIMEAKRLHRNLMYEGTNVISALLKPDMFPEYMNRANELGFSGEVFLDTFPENRKVIGTHSGTFHSDEALAVSLLRTLPEYRDHGISSGLWLK